MAVTMAEIAERAGVAKVTVSLALRNSRKVATDTRKRGISKKCRALCDREQEVAR